MTRVLIKGAGDLATGVAQALHQAGMELLLTEIAQPLAIRRTVALSQVIYDGRMQVEELQGCLVQDLAEARAAQARGELPVLVDRDLACLADYQPDVLVEATLCKFNTGIKITDAPLTVALGPGYRAGQDVRVAVETMRGHDLARLIDDGSAFPDTGEPGVVAGYSTQRLLRASGAGVFQPCRQIGDLVELGEVVAYCGDTPLAAHVTGCLRGILQAGIVVKTGDKVGDVDPRGEVSYCYTVSDKARALGGAVLRAICRWQATRAS